MKQITLTALTCTLLALSACDQRNSAPEPTSTSPKTSGTELNGPMQNYQGKAPTLATLAVLAEVENNLPIGDFADGSMMTDHSNDRLIAKLPRKVGTIEFDKFAFFSGERPAPINPSLFTIVQDTYQATGLYQVAEDIYQIRGDLAYVTLVRGKQGWIILDPGTSKEFSGQAWAFSHPLLPGGTDVPVSAVVYSHSHVDHFGGVKGFVTQADVDEGRTEIIAPHGFMEEALAENVIAGDAMLRRAQYQFGASLDIKADGTEFSSLGVALAGSIGTFTLIAPTRELPEGRGKITEWVVDGINIHFKDISEAEAPAATMMYLPDHKTIFNSELMYRGMHNIYTLRGAQVRDALGWSKMINAVIQQWGDSVETMIGPHGPSFSGNEKILEFMRVQRDNYGFLHNQTLRLINSGMKLQDVGQAIEDMVPRSLSQVWHTHGYHGTYSHNARGVVNRYIGFYDGNPANLNPLQIKPEAIKFVEYMGGSAAIMQRAREDFKAGNYRFVATVMNKVVTAEPDNWPARHLLADTFEQLGYQAEGPQWRNPYLTAAKELRTGEIIKPRERGQQTDMLAAATVENLLDSVAVRINAEKAESKSLSLMFVIPDTEEKYLLELSNSNLSYIAVDEVLPADTTLTISKHNLLRIMSGEVGVMELVNLGLGGIEGSVLDLVSLLRLVEKNNQFYDVVPMPTS
ncbi:MAG: alkyl sulfatase dimerization domain-containing protein [Pseudomonadota bacterium]